MASKQLVFDAGQSTPIAQMCGFSATNLSNKVKKLLFFDQMLPVKRGLLSFAQKKESKDLFVLNTFLLDHRAILPLLSYQLSALELKITLVQ